MKTTKLILITILSLLISVSICQRKILQVGAVDPDSVGGKDATKFQFDYTGYSSDYISFTVFPIDPQPPALPGNVTVCYSAYTSSSGETTPIACTDPNDESFILPPQSPAPDSIYIDVTTTNPSPLQITVSASIVLDALDSKNKQTNGNYIISGSVSSGFRQFYFYNPTTEDQQIQIEICSSVDNSGNNNVISGSFLFNRTSDHLSSYNQTLYDYPCGLSGTHGTVKVLYPNSNEDSTYLKICPTYAVTSGPLSNTFFAIDVFQFWDYPMKNGTVNYKINIDPSFSTVAPLIPAGEGNPSWIYVAEFVLERSGDDAVVTFDAVSTNSGPPSTDTQYALYTDYSVSDQVKQYLTANTSMSSSCYLLSNNNLLASSWVPSTQLTAATGNDVTFSVKDFFKTYSESTTFHVNLVASSASRGSFAYTYYTIENGASDDGLGGWAITFIVLGSIVGAAAIVLVLGVIGYFAFMKYKNRSKYELL